MIIIVGINEGINSIIAAIGGEYKAEDTDDDGGFPFIFLIIMIIIAFSFMRGGGPFVPGWNLQNRHSFQRMV